MFTQPALLRPQVTLHKGGLVGRERPQPAALSRGDPAPQQHLRALPREPLAALLIDCSRGSCASSLDACVLYMGPLSTRPTPEASTTPQGVGGGTENFEMVDLGPRRWVHARSWRK